MDHIAIMNKSWNLIPKILDGRKTIESRWSKFKIAPWGKIKKGDTVYFKNSGEAVTAKAKVSKVLSFEDLTEDKIKKIAYRYGGKGKICSSSKKSLYDWAKHRRYCTLIYLSNPKTIRPFGVDKTGYGITSAWMCVGKVKSVKVR